MKNLVSLGIIPTLSRPLEGAPYDIGFRCPVTQSSAFSPLGHASVLYPAEPRGAYFFHTDVEDNPWLVVDLEAVRVIGQMRIWNREDVGIAAAERAVPLIVSVSSNLQDWEELVKWEECFGGRLSGKPLSLSFAGGVRARYVRLQVPRHTFLHLDYVEVFQMQPKLAFGEMVNMTKSSTGQIKCEYLHSYNSGLYSGYSTALQDIVALAGNGVNVAKIDLTKSFRHFKERADEDVYPKFFLDRLGQAADSGRLLEACRGTEFDCYDVHKLYKDLPLGDLNKIAQIAFAPSEAVQQMAEHLLASYGIEVAKTIAIVYRGTDKSSELTLAPVERYIEVAAELRRTHPSFKVLIQTDQEQARDQMSRFFGDDSVFFDDLPVTTGNTAIHLLPGSHAPRDKLAFSIQLMAAALIVSRCKFLVLHTGNVAAWIAIYRGNANNIFQFDKHGGLISPPEMD